MRDSANHETQPSQADRIAAIYDAEGELLQGLAMRYGVPADDAEVIVHEVFLSFIRNESRVQNARTWLIGAVCKASKKYWEVRGRRVADVLPEDLAGTTPDHVSRVDTQAAMAQLGERCRDAIHLRYLEGYTPEELATHFATTTGYAKLILARCLRKLRELLGATRKADR